MVAMGRGRRRRRQPQSVRLAGGTTRIGRRIAVQILPNIGGSDPRPPGTGSSDAARRPWDKRTTGRGKNRTSFREYSTSEFAGLGRMIQSARSRHGVGNARFALPSPVAGKGSPAHDPRASSCGCGLPVIRYRPGSRIDLLPIVEDGLVGYEFLPELGNDRRTSRSVATSAASRCCARAPYRARGAAASFGSASVDGRTLLPEERARRRASLPPSAIPSCPIGRSAAEAAWTELAALFPEQPRQGIEVHDAPHAVPRRGDGDRLRAPGRCRIRASIFAACPDEAHYGFALKHADGGRGQLDLPKTGDDGR